MRSFHTMVQTEITTIRIFFTVAPRSILILSRFIVFTNRHAVNWLTNNFKIYIKIDIKAAATCFGAVSDTVIRGRIAGTC